MAKTITKPCTCESAYQDKTYGKGVRLHNVGGGSKTVATAKCTVCGKKN